MPLSPSDVRFINKRLDQHLKTQRTWPWLRFVWLGISQVLLVGGCLAAMVGSQITQVRDDLMPDLTSRPRVVSTRPVTYEDLEELRQFNRIQTQFDVNMSFAVGMSKFAAAVHFGLGCGLVGWTLKRWNQHRRDVILITLLREKCAAELSEPATTSS